MGIRKKKELTKRKSKKGIKYMTRNQILKKLNLSIADFRRICILKGIYPRDPPKKLFGSNKTYYLTKDINFLRHDPLLQVFHTRAQHRKKVRSAIATKNSQTLAKLKEAAPKVSLNHLILERYPNYIDALRDLDDPINLISLYASVAINKRLFRIDSHASNAPYECRRLSLEWKNYIIQSRSLTKTFLSIKGIYYQACIAGAFITWIEPYNFRVKVPEAVDLRIVGTFLDFYTTLVSFVLFKLYQNLNSPYPLHLNTTTTTLPELSEKFKKSMKDKQKVNNNPKKKHMVFENCVFSLGRETNHESLYFVICSGGGEVVEEQDGGLGNERVTHYVGDKDYVGHRWIGRVYVQPQWVYDCLNEARIIREEEYEIGKKLPPHLSPFVDDEWEGYKPERRKELEEMFSVLDHQATSKKNEKEEEKDTRTEEEKLEALENQWKMELENEQKTKTTPNNNKSNNTKSNNNKSNNTSVEDNEEGEEESLNGEEEEEGQEDEQGEEGEEEEEEKEEEVVVEEKKKRKVATSGLDDEDHARAMLLSNKKRRRFIKIANKRNFEIARAQKLIDKKKIIDEKMTERRRKLEQQKK
eukprot:TRINITY_DN4534_c0_g3_i2.p1 TRINITY_DN4534_c0_g3~~TRINITY_DN4534_c0_g3_i2.p1  ORF type:complete len:584 (-),score=208.81 TRINITY_DN4534_c0_g3_i2:48-1799(-)